MKTKYVPCTENERPTGISWDSQQTDRGQTVEVEWGAWDRGAKGPGDAFCRWRDLSDGRAWNYERRVGPDRG